MENEDIYLILEKINEVLQFQNIVLLSLLVVAFIAILYVLITRSKRWN